MTRQHATKHVREKPIAEPPLEQLGTNYERSLSRQARSAGGVYYTPPYVVKYMVDHTVGALLAKCRSPAEVAKIRVLDPACGSGYFLLGAYEAIDAWYERHFAARLTAKRKRQILSDNLWGIDIDPQAIELARVCLTRKAGLAQWSGNLRCGNSLTEPVDGRFDIVIGNPPYRRELQFKELMDEIARTPLGAKYRSPRMDLWYYFLHRALELTKPGGLISFIVNSYWTSGTGAEKLIAHLRESAHIDEIFSLGKLRVFDGVSGHHMILRVSNRQAPSVPTTIKIAREHSDATAESVLDGRGPPLEFQKTHDELFRDSKVDIQNTSGNLLALFDRHPPLSSLGIIRQGIAENPAAINRKTNDKHGSKFRVGQGVFALRADERKRLNLPPAEKSLLRDYHDLCDIGRYYVATKPSLTLIYSTRDTCPDIEAFPTIKAHLSPFRPILEERRETRNGSNSWWHLHWPREERIWESPKILSVQMAERPTFALAIGACYVPFSVNVFVPSEELREDLRYILGLLNSKVLWHWYRHHAKCRGVGLEINGGVLANTPIRRIDFANGADGAMHDEMVELVKRMIDLRKRRAKAVTRAKKDTLECQIVEADRRIDELAFDLYEIPGTASQMIRAEE